MVIAEIRLLENEELAEDVVAGQAAHDTTITLVRGTLVDLLYAHPDEISECPGEQGGLIVTWRGRRVFSTEVVRDAVHARLLILGTWYPTAVREESEWVGELN